MKKIVITLLFTLLFSFFVVPQEAKATPSIPSLLVQETSSTTKSSHTTASFSATSGALLVVMVTGGNSSGTFNFNATTDTFSDVGAWTEHVDHNSTASNSFTTYIATAQVGAGGSGTITVTASTSIIRWIVTVYEVTDFNTITPVQQAKSDSGVSTTLTLTLDSTPAADSMVFAVISDRDTNLPIATVGTNFTELDEALISPAGQQTQYDRDSAGTSVPWTGLSSISNIGGAIEINAAAGGRTTSATSTAEVAPLDSSGGTWSITIKPDDVTSEQVLMHRPGVLDDGFRLWIEDRRVYFSVDEPFCVLDCEANARGEWMTSSQILATSTQTTIAVEHDFNGNNLDPVIVVDGTVETLTENAAPGDTATAAIWQTLYVAGDSADTEVYTGDFSEVCYIDTSLSGNALINLTSGVRRICLQSGASQYWPIDEYTPGDAVGGYVEYNSMTASSSLSVDTGNHPSINLIYP